MGGKNSIAAITNYTVANSLGGIFVFDTSMDTVSSGGQFTYELMNQIANQLDAATPSPAPAPVSQKYKCSDNVCVVSSDGSGVDEDTCKSISAGSSVFELRYQEPISQPDLFRGL